jgi:hypothetical protein
MKWLIFALTTLAAVGLLHAAARHRHGWQERDHA